MYKEIELETHRYWNEVQQRDEQYNRLLKKEAARERILMWSLLGTGCGIALIGLACGWFNDMDFAALIEGFQAFWRS